MLKKISSFFSKQPDKAKRNVKLTRPSYVNRHKGCDFLILATGPSLKQYKDKIQKFIDLYKPVVMAGNFIDNMFIPDYHAFVNRKRFCTYVKYTNPASKVLLSPYFPEHVIKSHYGGDYEEIAFKNQYPSDDGEIIISDGIIYAKGATVATILISVAVVMGANKVFIAGMDGYSKSVATHHHHEPDSKNLEELLRQEKSMRQQLKCLKEYLNNGLTVITPTAYEHYYKPVDEFLKETRV
jgi:4-hydroxy 2-oxovalerate aldolase